MLIFTTLSRPRNRRRRRSKGRRRRNQSHISLQNRTDLSHQRSMRQRHHQTKTNSRRHRSRVIRTSRGHRRQAKRRHQPRRQRHRPTGRLRQVNMGIIHHFRRAFIRVVRTHTSQRMDRKGTRTSIHSSRHRRARLSPRHRRRRRNHRHHSSFQRSRQRISPTLSRLLPVGQPMDHRYHRRHGHHNASHNSTHSSSQVRHNNLSQQINRGPPMPNGQRLNPRHHQTVNIRTMNSRRGSQRMRMNRSRRTSFAHRQRFFRIRNSRTITPQQDILLTQQLCDT